MEGLFPVYLTAGVIGGYLAIEVLRKAFDPFAPVWLFVIGYFQVYVIQAISYHEYAMRVRGVEVITEANIRALWAIVWFLLVYQIPIGRWFSAKLPQAPTRWSAGTIVGISPILIVWGLAGAFLVSHDLTKQTESVSQETYLLLSFPILTLIAAILLIVTGRNPARPRPILTISGVLLSIFYVLLWTYNGKRSHSLIGVLTTICAFYVSRGKRPSFLTLGIVAVIGATAVTLSLGWRNNLRYERSVGGFVDYLGDFDLQRILVNLNIGDRDESGSEVKKALSYETEEYCGYLLMLDTVPMKSPHDFGSSYLRIVSTYIPRIVWPDKPYYGREEWVAAWIAGSEFKRDATFTGPAIGILGATQLNGGGIATAIVMAALAILLRTAYEYFRRYADRPWAQAWWSLTFYNAWLMTVNDDPFVWYYYIYGHTTLPPMLLLWISNRLNSSGEDARAASFLLGRWGQVVKSSADVTQSIFFHH